MKKILVLLFFVSFFVSIQVLNAQAWMRSIPKEKMKKGQFNFYDIQKTFNQYWKTRDIKKVKGWVQFKRWEYFMEPRVYPSGWFPHHILWEELNKKRAAIRKRDISDELPASWTAVGPFTVPANGINGIGRIDAIAFDPGDSDIIWAGSPSGGLWKSTDGGSSWSSNTDHLPNLGVSDIAIDPTNPDIIYISTGDRDHFATYSYGILKSTDGGATWDTTGLSFSVDQYRKVNRILIDPTNTTTLLAATSIGIYRSTDSGANWTLASGNIHFKSMEFKPGDPDVVYAGSYGYGSAKIYRSSDNGQTWTQISSGLPASGVRRIAIGVSSAEADTVYALYAADDSGFYGLYKSTDSGLNWSMVSNSPNLLDWSTDGSGSGGLGWYALVIAVSPSNINVVFVGGVNVWKSTDGGSTWSLTGHQTGSGGADFIHADHHAFEFIPGTDTLFSGNDGGIYKTTDGGTNWLDLSNGLVITQFYRMGSSFTNPELLIGGCQDNGTNIYDSGNWEAAIFGDGMECIIDYSNENVMYGETYSGEIRKSTNKGQTFTALTSLPPYGTGAWVTPYVMHPTDNNTLYAGFSDVYKTTDAGSTWTTISTNLTGGTNLTSLCVAPSDPNYIYAATGTQIWRTTSGGPPWTEITSGLPDNYITYITVANEDPDKVWVTFSGYIEGNKVYASTNGGASWSNYSTGLPNIPINCIVYKNYSNDALFVGTDLGVYYRDNDMTGWEDYSEGLPNVIVNELEISYTSDKLIAATYGRGMFSTDISHAFPDRDPVDIMLVLDLSGSMLSEACSSCEPKLQVLKDAVEIFVQLWKTFTATDDRIGVNYFRTTIEELVIVEDEEEKVLVKVFPNTDTIINDVRSQTTVGSNLTAMGGGIQTAIQRL
ncbi:MAG: hypothetical protein JSV88_21010, partial [Candidatus Aminicenantes bacterium]